MKILTLMLLIASYSLTPSLSAEEDNNGLLNNVQLLKQLMLSSRGEYVNYCGQDNWKKAGWKSEKHCLQDGRVHLVYYNDEKGEPGLYKLRRSKQEIQFSLEDKNMLFDIMEDRATLYVGLDSTTRVCDGVNVTWRELWCSTSESILLHRATSIRNSSGVPKGCNSKFPSFHRYSTDGKLFFITIDRREKGCPGVRSRQNWSDSSYSDNSWFIRY